jgi:tetratricopeptide (TPR) repeat protein
MDWKLNLRCLSLTILVVGLSDLAAAADPLLNLADSLMHIGFYEEAITEYSRYMFFNPDREIASDAYSKIGYCHAYLGRFDEAIGTLDKSIFLAANDSIARERRINRLAILMASGNYGSAEFQLKKEIGLSADDKPNKRARILLFLDEILMHKWQDASATYRILSKDGGVETDSLTLVLARAAKAGRKSPETAMMLSALFPGLGQIYVGKYLAGLDALALNVGLGYWTVSDIIKERYVSGALVFTFLFRRYFIGNRIQAYDLAVKRNAGIDDNYERQILNIVSAKFSLSDSVLMR